MRAASGCAQRLHCATLAADKLGWGLIPVLRFVLLRVITRASRDFGHINNRKKIAKRCAATTTTPRQGSGNGKSQVLRQNGGTHGSIDPSPGRHMMPSCRSASTPCSYIRAQLPTV